VDARVAATLAAAGIDSLDALAKAKPAALKAALTAAGLDVKALDPASWTKQAKQLVAGA
jgi:hypothetical protein